MPDVPRRAAPLGVGTPPTGRRWRPGARAAPAAHALARLWRHPHVVLPAGLLVDRAYSATVIGTALAAAAAGWGHRRIAGAVGVPASTGRGWLRRLRARADVLGCYFTQVAYRLDANLGRLDPPGGWRSPVDAAVGLLAAATVAYERRLGPTGQTPWQLASAVSSGLLLANTSRPFPPHQPVRHAAGHDLDAPRATARR